MNDVAARISALSADRLKILARRLAADPSRPAGIRREPEVQPSYPLSFSQEGIWFLCRLSPDSTAYSNPIPVRIVAPSPLDLDVLERCFTEVVRRHEALRTTFTIVDGQPVQIINPPFPVHIPFRDLRTLAPTERERESLRIAREEGCRPFDLVVGPLVRVTALRTGECTYLLLLTPHHLVSDGWSNGILIRELTHLYQSFSAGLPSDLADPAVRYVDCMLWQRERLSGEYLDRLVAYWRRQLGGQLPVLALPTVRARPSKHDHPGEIVTRFVPPASAGRLRALASSCQATLFETLLSVFYLLLHRYTGRSDLIVGSPVANRTRPEMEGIVGLFLNTLCLRIQLGDDLRFMDFVKRVQRMCREAFEHQELPFEYLVRELCPRRSLRHSPLFQTMFILQNAHLQLAQGDVTITPVKLGYGTAKFDLTLQIEELEGGLHLAAEFRSDLFPASFIEVMLREYEWLLMRVADAADQRIEQHLLALEEREDPVDQPGSGRFGGEEPFPSRLDGRVAEAPDAIAVCCGSQELTYRELDCRANRLAHCLQSLGADAETPVPVLTGRSAADVVALLAIAKAGARFLPIDGDWPVDRIDAVLQDSAARLLVTGSAGRPAGMVFDGEAICPDSDGALASLPETAPSDVPGAETPARYYVLDRLMRPLPLGVVGELFIGGRGLASGYQHNPDLTAGRFVPDPLSTVAGANMYNTGDLARWRLDGALEICGRASDRVQIRGGGTEPLDVAAILDRHPDVAQAVVLPRKDRRGRSTLVGYVVPRPECQLTERELTSFLKRRLPEHMLPSGVAVLPRLPLGSDGKFDWDALLALPDAGTTMATAPPRDAIELRLVMIWEEVLEREPIAVTDDFFELGGHSLLAVRLLSRIEADFGKSLPLALLFEEGTVERLAARLREDPADAIPAPLVRMRIAGTGPTVFFVHPAGGNVLCYDPLARALAGTCRFSAFQMPPDCQDELMVEEMATRYVRALVAEQDRGPYFLGGWSMGAIVAHEMARQLEERGQRIGLVAILDQPAPSAATPLEADHDASELAILANQAASYAGRATEISYETLKLLGREDRRRRLLKEFLQAGLVPPDTELASFSAYVDVHRRHMTALRRYSGGVIASPLVLFRSAEPRTAALTQAEEAMILRPDMGWAERTSGPFSIELVPGTHATLISPPHVETLAGKLATHIGKALAADLRADP